MVLSILLGLAPSVKSNLHLGALLKQNGDVSLNRPFSQPWENLANSLPN